MAKMKTMEALRKLPQMLCRGRLAFDFDGIPQVAERVTWRQRRNLLKAGIDSALGRARLSSVPPVIQVEPTNVCNLKCPLCPTGAGQLPRKKGYMDLEVFKALLDDVGDTAIAIYLFCFGEPFLHPKLPEMIEACTRRGLLTFTTTNGHRVRTMDEALRIVDAGLTTLLVAVDGSTQEVYSAYRRRGDLEEVKRCISLVREAREKRGSSFPYIAVRSVVSRQNEEDLPAIERLAEKLGADMFTYKTLGCLSHVEGYEEFEPGTDKFKRFGSDGDGRAHREPFHCQFPFRQPIVFWDGTVVGCEYDHDLERAFGKIGEQPFREIWNSENAVALRREVRSNKDRADFCGHCPFQDRIQDGSDLYTREFGEAR